MVILQGCLKNFAGIENRQLYSHRYYGTKNLVEEYYQEVVKCLELINQDNDNDNDDNEKLILKMEIFQNCSEKLW